MCSRKMPLSYKVTFEELKCPPMNVLKNLWRLSCRNVFVFCRKVDAVTNTFFFKMQSWQFYHNGNFREMQVRDVLSVTTNTESSTAAAATTNNQISRNRKRKKKVEHVQEFLTPNTHFKKTFFFQFLRSFVRLFFFF